jgi:hypothetical protein
VATSATLPDSTVSGGIWEKRNAKAKFKSKVKVKAKVSRTVQPSRGLVQAPPPTFFPEREERFRGG